MSLFRNILIIHLSLSLTANSPDVPYRGRGVL